MSKLRSAGLFQKKKAARYLIGFILVCLFAVFVIRLKYVDIPSMLEADVEKAIRARVEDGVSNLYVLVNYTALFGTRNILKRMEGEKE